MSYAEVRGTLQLLMELGLGKVKASLPGKRDARHCSGGLTAAVIVGLDISEGLLPPAPLRHISADRTGW